MARPKRKPANSVDSIVDAMRSAAEGDIRPPSFVLMREGDEPFWSAIVRTRARREWTEADLVNAANMARSMADIERISREIRSEGDTIENFRGTPVVNPKHALLEQLSRRVMALSRLLQMHAGAAGRIKDVGAMREQERTAREIRSGLEDEAELIPMG